MPLTNFGESTKSVNLLTEQSKSPPTDLGEPLM